MTSSDPSFGNLRALSRLFAYADYRTYTIGNSVSLIGTWMQRITVGWLAWELTGSGTWLGLIVSAELFPVLVFGTLAGAVADRLNLLVLLKITQSFSVLQASLLAALHFLGLLEIYGLFAIALVLGVNSAFYQAARLSIVPALVPRDDLGPAIAFNAVTFNLARFLGPAAAGFVIASAGIGWGFVGNALSSLVFVVALLMIPAVVAQRPKRARTNSLMGEIREGLAYTFRRPGVPMVLLVTVAVGLCARPIVELLPGFASGVFDRGAEGLATLTASVGLGAIAGGVWMMGRGSRPGLTSAFALCALGSAVSIGLFVAVGRFALAVPGMAALGFFMVSNGIAGQTLVHLATDEAMRGRVLSFWGILQRGAPAVGSLLIGTASDWIGLRQAAAVAAIILAASAVCVMARARRLARHLDP